MESGMLGQMNYSEKQDMILKLKRKLGKLKGNLRLS
jgi:hypothetical protein